MLESVTLMVNVLSVERPNLIQVFWKSLLPTSNPTPNILMYFLKQPENKNSIRKDVNEVCKSARSEMSQSEGQKWRKERSAARRASKEKSSYIFMQQFNFFSNIFQVYGTKYLMFLWRLSQTVKNRVSQKKIFWLSFIGVTSIMICVLVINAIINYRDLGGTL